MQDTVLEKGGTSPFNAYRLLSVAFNSGLVGLGSATVLLRRFKSPLPVLDLVMLGAATHKLALIITEERVTMPLRSPFTKQSDHGREGGHHSEPKPHGMHRALGELLTCPHCIAPWLSLALVAGYVVAPLPTRAVTTVFSTVAAADLLFHATRWLEANHKREKQELSQLEQAQRREDDLRAVHVS